MAKTILVTGASAGIGEATAIYLAQNGYNVVRCCTQSSKNASCQILYYIGAFPYFAFNSNS